MNIRKQIADEMAADARARRLERYRKMAVPEAMAGAMAGEDEATDAAAMPDVGALKVDKMEDVNDDDFKRAMALFEEDEEDAKWMAKQRG